MIQVLQSGPGQGTERVRRHAQLRNTRGRPKRQKIKLKMLNMQSQNQIKKNNGDSNSPMRQSSRTELPHAIQCIIVHTHRIKVMAVDSGVGDFVDRTGTYGTLAKRRRGQCFNNIDAFLQNFRRSGASFGSLDPHNVLKNVHTGFGLTRADKDIVTSVCFCVACDPARILQIQHVGGVIRADHLQVDSFYRRSSKARLGGINVVLHAFAHHFRTEAEPGMRPEVTPFHARRGVGSVVDNQLVGAASHVQRSNHGITIYHPEMKQKTKFKMSVL